MCEIIEEIREYCLEIIGMADNSYHIVVDKYNVNKVQNMLKDVGAELQFNYGVNIHIDVKF